MNCVSLLVICVGILHIAVFCFIVLRLVTRIIDPRNVCLTILATSHVAYLAPIGLTNSLQYVSEFPVAVKYFPRSLSVDLLS